MGERVIGRRALVVALLLIVAALVGHIAWREYRDRYVVERQDGRAIAGVVTAAFAGRSDLRVATLSGTVQSVATASRAGGLLTSDQVIKAPYSVDYFVNMADLSLADYAWDEERRVLTVKLPPVEIGTPNIDESRRTLVRTRGLYVSRGAAEELSQETSTRAQRLVGAEAAKPERLRGARDNARRAVASYLRPALAVAGLGEVRVEAVFADEVRGAGDRWDVSRSLRDVLADPKYR